MQILRDTHKHDKKLPRVRLVQRVLYAISAEQQGSEKSNLVHVLLSDFSILHIIVGLTEALMSSACAIELFGLESEVG